MLLSEEKQDQCVTQCLSSPFSSSLARRSHSPKISRRYLLREIAAQRMRASEIVKRRVAKIATLRVRTSAVRNAQENYVYWTPIWLIGFALLMIAELTVFRIVLPSHTAEGILLRIINAGAWIFAVLLLVIGAAWIVVAPT